MAYIANQDRKLCFIDCETTGLTPGHNEAIEWAAILTEPDGVTVVKTFEAKVKPLHMDRFDAKAKEVNGYNEAEWANALPAKEVAAEMMMICAGSILVGQNVKFDIGFLEAFLKEHNFKPAWHHHSVCTLALAWPLVKQGAISGLSLTHLCTWAGISQPPPHRAMTDAQCVKTVYVKLMENYLPRS